MKRVHNYKSRDWRFSRYRVGAWAFLLHRLSGVLIALYGVSHILVMASARSSEEAFNRLMRAFQQPWVLALELALIAVILYHGLNGFRIILFDLGVGIRRQKGLFWGLMALGLVLVALTTLFTLPYLLGKELS